MLVKLSRNIAIASAVLCLCAMPVQAVGINTVLELKDRCISATALNGTSCSSYIQGVIRGYWATVATLKKRKIRLEFFCAPNLEIPDMQGSEAYVRKYINSHREDDQRDAGLVIFEALSEAYGCKS